MEIVLLWLDDLDDLLFTTALVWERLRRALLQLGLTAAFGLAASDAMIIASEWAPVCCAIAAATVSCWLLGAAARAYYYRTVGTLASA
jgi:hypothetical protein